MVPTFIYLVTLLAADFLAHAIQACVSIHTWQARMPALDYYWTYSLSRVHPRVPCDLGRSAGVDVCAPLALLGHEGLVLGEVAPEHPHVARLLEGQRVAADPVQEPAVVRDDHRAACRHISYQVSTAIMPEGRLQSLHSVRGPDMLLFHTWELA